MRRALAGPALHFLILGALLVAGDRLVLRDTRELSSGRPTIAIERARIEALRAGWLARTGESPDAAALRALVEAEIDDELLLHEAWARGLAARDPVVRARLARNVGFLHGEDERAARAGDARSVNEALALGLERSDLVVRRRLIERMRAEFEAGAGAQPSQAEIEARFSRDASRLAGAKRVRLSHVFLSRDRHGVALAAEAVRLRRQIAREGLALEAAIESGDAFLLGHAFAASTRAELERVFGASFARAVFALEPGRFSEPIASGYGLHLVVVHERLAGASPTLASERARIEAELAREREGSALRLALDGLRVRYEIRVAELRS
ncbi:MAG: peptidylprolyl isomerase [Myxococcota bacterium]